MIVEKIVATINHHYWRNSKFIYTEYAFYKFTMHEKKNENKTQDCY